MLDYLQDYRLRTIMDDGRPTGKKERPISPIDDDFLDTYEDERHPRECSSPCERTHKDSSLAAVSIDVKLFFL
jgi:hypothetical protein